jgi:hypothetical protein
MAQARWRRRVAPMMWFVAVACGGDDESPQEDSTQDDVEMSAGAGGREPASDAGSAPVRDAAAADAGSAPATASDTGAPPTTSGSQEIYYRLDKFVLKQPELVLRVLSLETPVTSEVQGMLNTALKDDVDPTDGNIDLNVLLRFSGTSDPTQASGKVTFGGGLCPHPADPAKPCRPEAKAPFFEPAMSFDNASACELEGGAQSVAGTCFESGTGRMAVNFLLFGPVLLDDAQLIAVWTGKDGISEGWIRGFVTEQTAMDTKIAGAVPSHLSLVGVQTGTPLADFLPQAGREMRGGRAGWPFLVQFAAKPARFDGAR